MNGTSSQRANGFMLLKLLEDMQPEDDPTVHEFHGIIRIR